MALSNLEEILIWLIRAEISSEVKGAGCFDSLKFWSDFEWVFDPLAGGFIVHFK